MNPSANENKFVELITSHEPMIHKICRIYSSDEMQHQDLFQEIIIQLWKSFERFRGESAFSTWMYRVAINTAISVLRKQYKSPKMFSLEQLQNDVVDSNENFAANEQLKKLHSSIERLNSVEKGIVLLYLEDKSYDEMEEILGISSGTLRVRMSRIKDKLKSLSKSL